MNRLLRIPFLILLFLTSLTAQRPDIDPDVLRTVFGSPRSNNQINNVGITTPIPIDENLLKDVFGENNPATRSTIVVEPKSSENIGRNVVNPLSVPTPRSTVADSKTPVPIDEEILKNVFGGKPIPVTNRNDPKALNTKIDIELIRQVFGMPNETSTPPSSHAIPRPVPLFLKTENNETCQCVPYYLCDKNRQISIENTNLLTGWGNLDIRFGEDECQESIEVCCVQPKRPEEVPKPTPDSTQYRGCGYRNPDGVGAKFSVEMDSIAQFGEFPWVIALLADNVYAGVGVIIHPQVVMSTAHIITKYKASQLTVRAGEWDTQTVNEILDFQDRAVTDVATHEDFGAGGYLYNDISLLRLDQPLEFAEHISALCLPEQDESFDNSKNCFANGWGKDIFGQEGRYAVILKKVELSTVKNGKCNVLLKNTKLGPRYRLHESFICAINEAGEDTCQGDGGAPLACPMGNNRYKLAGLVAGGVGCGQQGIPSVYAAVAKFRRWVDTKMESWGYQITDTA